MDEPAPWTDSASLAAVLAQIAELRERQSAIDSELAECRAQIEELERERRERIAALLAGKPQDYEERAVDGN
ncbi:MAG TPA: hypothetical protein VGE07_14515 [Herpetosiphonaceae bacterium]